MCMTTIIVKCSFHFVYVSSNVIFCIVLFYFSFSCNMV